MSRLYQGPLHVSYSQAYVGDPEYFADLDECFQEQANGLCGAAAPGQLHLATGLYLGSVHITVDVLESAPTLDLDAWEEVVEATFTVLSGRAVILYDWYRDHVCSLPLLVGTYRVRYCACGMDQGMKIDTLGEGDKGWPADRYALIFWPALAAVDVIHKQTSENATYLHRAFGGRHA